MTKKALVFWFTGLSGAGKSTIADGAKSFLEKDGYGVFVLDGDDVRKRLHMHLGFSEKDIKKNNSLIAGLCRKYRQDYDVILVPIISPYESSRNEAREVLKPGFFEIYISCDLETVVKRDVKGLYSRAARNEIDNLIGYSPGAVYERPRDPDFIVNSGRDAKERSIEYFYEFILTKLKQGVKNEVA